MDVKHRNDLMYRNTGFSSENFFLGGVVTCLQGIRECWREKAVTFHCITYSFHCLLCFHYFFLTILHIAQTFLAHVNTLTFVLQSCCVNVFLGCSRNKCSRCYFYDVADRLTNLITLSCGNYEYCRGLEQHKDLQKLPVLLTGSP